MNVVVLTKTSDLLSLLGTGKAQSCALQQCRRAETEDLMTRGYSLTVLCVLNSRQSKNVQPEEFKYGPAKAEKSLSRP